MNNDLEQFSEERLMELIHESSKPEIEALARIALSVKQAKPVAWFVGDATLYNSDTVKAYAKRSGLPVSPLYTTPQPAHTEQDCWKLVPIEPTQEMVDAHISGMQSAGFSRAYRDMLASAPKPDGTLISEGTKNDSCQWNRDEDSVYSTGCGNEWQFTDGGLEDNKIKFCPYCSGKIAAPKPESE